VAVFSVFLLMYLYALRKRHVLHLTRLDRFDARYAIEANLINIGTGLGSIALAASSSRTESGPAYPVTSSDSLENTRAL
jgi:hypothetical protein